MSNATIPETDPQEDLYREVGRLIGHWNVVELWLTFILQALLQTDQHRAQMIYKEFSAFSTKIRLIQRLSTSYLADTKERAKLAALLDDSLGAVKVRNKYAHALWASNEDRSEFSLIQWTAPGGTNVRLHPDTPVNLKVLAEEIQRIGGLKLRLKEFVLNILPTMAISDKPLT